MAFSVGDVSDEVEVFALLATEKTVYGLDNHLDDVNVFPLVETSDIIGLSHLSFVEDDIDGTGMVYHVEPVAHVLTLAIDGQRLAMAYVVDEERDELLWELVRTIVVGAVGHDGRHAVSIVESTYKVVAAGLGSRVGRMGIVLGGFYEELLAISLVVLAT